MKFLGYVVIITGFIIMFLNGAPSQWGKFKSDMPIWKHLLIDLGGILVLGLGFFLIDK